MQSWKRVVGVGLSAGYAVKASLFGIPQGLRVLMYHSVSQGSPSDRADIYTISASRFTDQINYLTENQNNLALAVRPLLGTDDIGVAITFDDGYRDNLEVVAPLLIDRGFPFHVFVNPTFIMSNDRKYLDESGLRELAGLPGVTIGAHGFSHKKLTECSPAELRIELSSSKNWIEDKIGQEITSMAYPHGAHNQEVRSAAQSVGFKFAASSRFGIATAKSDRFALERTDIWASDNKRAFASKVRGYWDWMQYRT